MNRSTPPDPRPGDSQPAPGSEEKIDRLRALLREMFQLDRGDLDFGLYRVMRMKADEVAAFLDRDLLPQVQAKLEGVSAEDRARLDKELHTHLEYIGKLGGIDPDDTDLIKDLRRQLAEARADAEAEADVYNHLANFFARYYAEGDFMSQRRYSGGGDSAYLIPYDGEEVKLHWANSDQYYVKTTENYASYVFAVGAGPSAAASAHPPARRARTENAKAGTNGRRVRFEVTKADNEKDNIKEADERQRRFLLAGAQPVTVEGDDLVIRFEHRPLTDGEKKRFPGNGNHQQGRINAAAVERILNRDSLDLDWRALLAAPAPTEANGERTVLAMHLERYTAKNTFDYFIHKDLDGFLRRELDLYLKSEVLNLDDLALGDAARLRRALARMRTIRHVAEKIIAFLAQLEDFQKRLWLKKKFVLDTQYCVTLDRVPETLYPEVAANTAQREEWVGLLAIDEITGDLGNGGAGYGEPLTVEFLKANPFLVLDTRHFAADFKDRLLAALSDAGPIDEQLDGLLVHGENFQALNLLRARYGRQVDCIYIDPPFNTDAAPILYKNGYKSSTWISLMEDRLHVSRTLLAESGVLVAAIDDEQHRELNFLISATFDNRLLGTISVRTNPSGRPTRSGYSVAHEYLLYAGQGENSAVGRMPPTEKQMARFSGRDERGVFEWRNLRREGSGSDRTSRPTLYYPVFIKDRVIRIPEMSWNASAREWIIEEECRSGEQIVLPDDENGVQKSWRWERKKVMNSLSELAVRKDRSGQDYVYYKRRPHEEGVVSISCWFDAKYSSVEHGTALLKEIFGESVFSYPKSIHAVTDSIYIAGAQKDDACVLDFFAGSGTTGHAVINLNREGGRRKYILVEAGHHFDTVMLPRLKKVVYSRDWKDGVPVSREGGTQLFKYARLESYEDTLDSLRLTPRTDEQQELLAGNPELAEDYRLRYALGVETAGSPCLLGEAFADPFACTLFVVRDGARSEARADLPETFNYLIGLRVESHRRIDGVLAITGTDADRRRCLILWRNRDETDSTALEEWFAHNRARFPGPLDLVYVNGDHTLNAIRQPGETWLAETIEPIFRELMFEESGR